MKVCQMADEKCLKKELHSLLAKGAIAYVPLPERERGSVSGVKHTNIEFFF